MTPLPHIIKEKINLEIAYHTKQSNKSYGGRLHIGQDVGWLLEKMLEKYYGNVWILYESKLRGFIW